MGNKKIERVYLAADGVLTPLTNQVSEATSDYLGVYGYAYHPVDREYLDSLTRFCPYHGEVMTKRAELTTGYGFFFREDIDRHQKVKEFINGQVSKHNVKQSVSFKSVLDKLDLHAVRFGAGGLEISRVGGRVFIYPSNTKTMYANLASNGVTLNHWSQIVNGREYSRYNAYGKRKGSAHEYLEFTGKDTDGIYGKISYEASINTMIRLYKAGRWDSNMFDNGSNPAMIVKVTGGNLGTTEIEKIRQGINDCKGYENNDKTIFIQTKSSDAKIEVQKLIDQKDANFLNGKKDDREEIVIANRMLPQLMGIGTGRTNGGTENMGALKVQYETVIRPLQIELADFVNSFLYDEFGVYAGFEFYPLDMTSTKDDSLIFERAGQSGLITRGVGKEFWSRILRVKLPSDDRDNEIYVHGDTVPLKEHEGEVNDKPGLTENFDRSNGGSVE